MKKVYKFENGTVKKKQPLTLIELAGYIELVGGVALILLEQQILGGILIGAGSVHIMRNMINYAK